MGAITKIEWCDHTFNPWWGCAQVGPLCDHCYAMMLDARWFKRQHWGERAPRRTFLTCPITWTQSCEPMRRDAWPSATPPTGGTSAYGGTFGNPSPSNHNSACAAMRQQMISVRHGVIDSHISATIGLF